MMDKVNHIPHLEELILQGSKTEAMKITGYLHDTLMQMEGFVGAPISIKYDGSPSLFVGLDPKDKKFFVATKSIFNKKPKVYKTLQSILDEEIPDGLKKTLIVAFETMPALGITDVFQGDVLYTQDELMLVDGKVRFHPNTLVYQPSEEMAKSILDSKIGIVFHTRYEGTDLANLSCQLDLKLYSITKTEEVFFIGPNLIQMHRMGLYSEKLDDRIKGIEELIEATPEKIFAMPPPVADAIRMYYNFCIRGINGFPRGYPHTFSSDTIMEFIEYSCPVSLKKDSAEIIGWLQSNEVSTICLLISDVVYLKTLLVALLEECCPMKAFLKHRDGHYIRTRNEGFVVRDRDGKNPVKLINRFEFSHANFSDRYAKGWRRD